ncbi:MAG: hypothetical protein HY536_00910 [Candidatus Colwellbacteria bacterium]|nr:hypothetical protein [Candidatus Colwellbacteria bacterium]
MPSGVPSVQMQQGEGGFNSGSQEGSQGMPWFGGGENAADEGQIRQMMEDQQRKEAEERGLRDMKRGAQMMSREVTRVEQRLAALKKRSAPVSAEVEEAMQKMKALVAQVANAQTFDEIQEVDMGEFGELMQTVNEGLQKAEMALQFPRVSKEANREISRLMTAVKRAETRAKRLKIDVSALLAEWKSEVDTLVRVRDAAQKLFSSGETGEAIELLQDEVFGRLEDAHEKERIFQMVSDIQQMLKGVDKEIKSFEKTIARLKKGGKNVARLEELLAQGKARVADIRTLASKTPVDADALIETIEAAETVKQEFEEELAAVTGKPMPTIQQVPGLQSFKPIETPKELEMFMNKGQEGIQPPQGQTVPASGKELQGGAFSALQRLSDRVGEFLLDTLGF